MRLRTFLTEVFIMEVKAMMAVRPTRISTIDSGSQANSQAGRTSMALSRVPANQVPLMDPCETVRDFLFFSFAFNQHDLPETAPA